jgi:hypothetical protein
MEAIEAVVALVKERDELSETLDEYEDWFEELVGKRVSLQLPSKKKNKVKYVTAVVIDFVSGEGWTARDENTDTLYEIDFMDFVKGEAWIFDEKK